MYEIIKFSYKEFLRQTVNCELDVDSTCSILEQVDWGNIRQTNRSAIRNGERTPTHGSERIQPADT